MTRVQSHLQAANPASDDRHLASVYTCESTIGPRSFSLTCKMPRITAKKKLRKAISVTRTRVAKINRMDAGHPLARVRISELDKTTLPCVNGKSKSRYLLVVNCECLPVDGFGQGRCSSDYCRCRCFYCFNPSLAVTKFSRGFYSSILLFLSLSLSLFSSLFYSAWRLH